MKRIEGRYVILNSDKNLYVSLFVFTEAWKIDLMGFMKENYMSDLSLEDLARYTGRSLTTFKRDFKQINDLTPQRRILKKRL